MSASRIYIGNLNLAVKEKHLLEKFSNFGNVANVEIKNKLDIEGEPISKFAYISLQSEPSQIKECIYALDGSSLKGSAIKVEVARESFLERLKREREQNDSAKSGDAVQNNYNEEINYPSFSNSFDNQEKERTSQRQHYIDNEEINYPNYSNSFDNQENSSQWQHHFDSKFSNLKEDSRDQFNVLGDGISRRHDNNRKNRALSPPKIFSSFTRYDPAASANSKDRNEEKKPATSLNVKKSVKISSDLNFREESSGFSLRGLFDQEKDGMEDFPLRTKGDQRQIQDDTFEQHETSPCYRKKRFFITSDDPALEAGVEWLTHPLTMEMRERFDEIRPKLVSTYRHNMGQAGKKSEWQRIKSRIKKN